MLEQIRKFRVTALTVQGFKGHKDPVTYQFGDLNEITGHIHTCEWEELDVPISTLKCEKPRNMEKAQQYLEALRSGNADFPPLVCVNGMVIDGQHRFWAYQMAGYTTVKIYQNKPWVMPAAA